MLPGTAPLRPWPRGAAALASRREQSGGRGMGFLRTGLGAGAIGVVLLATPASALAETLTYKIVLSPTNEVPPVPTRATGSADVTYDTATRMVTWNVTHSGLSAAATAAHFHGPATPRENAPV